MHSIWSLDTQLKCFFLSVFPANEMFSPSAFPPTDMFFPSAFPPMSYAYMPHPAVVHYYSSLNLATMGSAMPHHVSGFVPYGSHEWMQQAYAQSMMQYMQQ